MIDFTYWHALLLLPLPLLMWRLAAPIRPQQGLQVPDRLAQLLAAASASDAAAGRYRLVRSAPIAAGWCALVLALAGPVTNVGELRPASGRDLLLAIDLSASMRERDVWIDGAQVDRYSAVVRMAGEFINGRVGDRVGLIVFADESYLLAPLSFDVAAVSGFLQQVRVGLPGRKTAVGDAIALAVKTLQNQPAESRVVILLSDGDGNAGVLSEAAASRLALSNQVRIHTIGFGRSDNGGADQARQAVLRSLADATGGSHYIAESSSALRQVYRQLDQLEPTESPHDKQLLRRAWVFELLSFALLMLALLTWQDMRRMLL